MNFKQLFATDKLLHASACFVLTVIFSVLLSFLDGNIAIGAICAIAIGAGKELYDVYKGTGFDLWDFAYDIMGAELAGFLLAILCA